MHKALSSIPSTAKKDKKCLGNQWEEIEGTRKYNSRV
jgi:hypothetical protein